MTKKPAPSSDAALARMKAAKPKDTAPEKSLRSVLFKLGLRYRVDARPEKELNRRADIVFRSAKVAVFIDGCFWHGCPIHGTQAKANAEFWRNKIKQNQERDIDTTSQLRKFGWKVVRVWEHENPNVAAKKIFGIVSKRKKKMLLAYDEWNEQLLQDFALSQFFREDDDVEYSLADVKEIYKKL